MEASGWGHSRAPPQHANTPSQKAPPASGVQLWTVASAEGQLQRLPPPGREHHEDQPQSLAHLTSQL